LKGLEEIGSEIDRKIEAFMVHCKFGKNYHRTGSLKDAVEGMFICLGAMAGDPNKLALNVSQDAPFIDFKCDAIKDAAFAKGCLEHIKAVFVALFEGVTKKLPEVAKRAESLPAEAEEAKKNAEGEISGMSMVHKG